MSVKFLESKEKTNNYRPVPWGWSEEPFPALRGKGQDYSAFLAVAKGMTEREVLDKPSKIIVTAKGTKLLVPCTESQDEIILMITGKSGHRCGFRSVAKEGAEILFEKSSGKHCVFIRHIVARLKDENSYIFLETSDHQQPIVIELFTYAGMISMTAKEYKDFEQSGRTITELLFCEKLKRLGITEQQYHDSMAVKEKNQARIKELTERMHKLDYPYAEYDCAIVAVLRYGSSRGTFLFNKLDDLEGAIKFIEDSRLEREKGNK